MNYIHTCPYNYRVARENVGTCYTGTGHDEGYLKNI